MPDYAGMTLGPYKLEMLLGKGGMASVYRAYQTSVKRYVAIKVMSAEIAEQPGFVERFEREAEVIASLEHPHILPVIDYGNANGVHYIVMRYIEGGSLEDRMIRKPLTLLDSARFLDQMSQALDYAHKRGVIHRDLKPNNVLLDSSENAYLTDFGIARLAQSDSKLTATGSVMGTPAYMSPEQAMGHTVDARSDIYTMGVVLYEMVLNQLPFSADTPAAYIFQHVYEQPKPPKLIKPDLPDSVVAVISRALAKNPDDRYPSAGEMSAAFSDALAGKNPTPPPVNSDVENTLVGGPLEVTPSTQSSLGTKGPLGTGSIVPPPPSQPPAATAGIPSGAGPQTFPYSAPVAGTPAPAAPPARRSSTGLLIGVVVAVLLILGGGGFFLFSSSNNANSTATAQAISANTGTAVAVLVLSSTHTATATASSTSTPVNTPTNTATETPNATLTAGAQAMAVVMTLQGNQTATQASQLTAAAAALTSTAGVAATQTQALVDQATQTAAQQMTATAVAGSATATRTRAPTSTKPPTATKEPSTATSAPVNIPATATALIGSLIQSGQLNATPGSVLMTRSFLNLNAPDAGFDYWNNITDSPVSDFIMTADVSWDSPDTGNGCGLLYRYNEPADNPDQRTYYAVAVSRDGHFRVAAREKDGYRSSFIIDQASSLINTDDGATNNLTLVAVGSEFQLYINGQLAGVYQDSAFDSGSLGIYASRDTDTKSLTCNFRNISAYALDDASLPGVTPSEAVPSESETPVASDNSLMSDNPSDVLAALEQIGFITGTPKLVVQDPSGEVSVPANETDTTRYSNPLSSTNYSNFILTTDIVSGGNENATDTECGIFYDGANVPDNLVTVAIDRAQNYSMYVRKNQVWNNDSVVNSEADAIKPGVGVTNRFTIVVIDGDVHLYINGSEAFEVADTTFTSGQVGYFIQKGKGSTQETCDYSNTTLWRLN